MESFLPQALVAWLTQYGSLAVFVLLTLGIFALPIPDETLMVFAGALMASGKLNPLATYSAAWLGACLGISISYVIGRTAGIFLIHRYGSWLRITEAKMQRIHNWFEKFGGWALFFGYFIPGIRHLTGYAAGISTLHFHKFAIFSYGGALLWSIGFLSLGYFLGNRWVHITGFIEEEQWLSLLFLVATLLLFTGLYCWLRRRRKPPV